MGIFRKYNRLLQEHPFKTNMVSSGIFFFIGDCIAQRYFADDRQKEEFKQKGLDLQRSARAITYGSFFFAPVGVIWYGRALPNVKNPFLSEHSRQTWSYTMRHGADSFYRTIVDQLIAPGFIWIPMYNTVHTFLSFPEHPVEEVKDRLQRNWWKILSTSWCVWPSFQLLNLFFVPPHIRTASTNLISIFWNCFLSSNFNKKHHLAGTEALIEPLTKDRITPNTD